MVKREKAYDTSLGRVRNTERKPVQPGCESELDETTDRHEGFYKPEMGTIVVNEYPGPHSES